MPKPRLAWNLDYIMERVEVDPEAECWVWQRHLSFGYGRLGIVNADGETLAHRAAYKLLVGPIPEGLQLDHLCRNKACVNPAHLEPVTPSENTKRFFVHGGKKTHCKYGHEFTEENTRLRPKGHRECRTCARRRRREFDERRVALPEEER